MTLSKNVESLLSRKTDFPAFFVRVYKYYLSFHLWNYEYLDSSKKCSLDSSKKYFSCLVSAAELFLLVEFWLLPSRINVDDDVFCRCFSSIGTFGRLVTSATVYCSLYFNPAALKEILLVCSVL